MTVPAGDRNHHYWGKASPEGDAAPGKHLLVYHLLDVAAVGSVVLDRHPTLLTRLAGLMGIDEELTRRWLSWLLAHHDIGKFAAAFQGLRPDLFPEEIPGRFRYTVRHDTLGFLVWQHRLLDSVFPWLEAYSPMEEAVLTLLRTSSGHHGRPPEEAEWSSFWFRDADEEAARSFSREASRLFFSEPLPPRLQADDECGFRDRVAVASWSLAGLAVLCDWIGSNRTWFPFVETAMPLEHYWEAHALPGARRAVGEAAILPEPASQQSGFSVLFPDLDAPTDLQSAANEVPLANGPQLLVIEDLTGSGKTEAALTMAGRMLSAGAAEGLYIALPTTATADAMYARVGNVYRRLFAPGSRPSLVLAHSRRKLSQKFIQSIGGERVEAEAPYEEGEPGAAATCAAWLADSRKKALLAQVGVGTIDQALLGALNVRHQGLRALGLMGKLLVVDEVHACDAYMNRLLEHLLQLHAAQGGNAMLLSATLPLETRERLVRAFAEGARFEPPATLPDAYPQLLSVAASGTHSIRAEPPPWSRRTLGFELIHDRTAAAEWVARKAAAGAAVCWIRNTVADVVEAHDLLTELLGPEHLTLFHARFVLGDRLDIEAGVLARFGRESTSVQRRGRVVVATQVIEQSLDLDFDEMLSDLAPIDLLLQRAGRLRRHRRDRDGNPCAGGDRRGNPVLHVLAPEPADQPPETWIRSFLPGTSFVYPDHGELWRTARLLRDRPTVTLPGDSRLLVEEVFGPASSLPLPDTLAANAARVEGRRRADASLGEVNAIGLDAGYGGGFDSWTDLEDTRTRLGEPTVTLRLARWDGQRLRPMHGDGTRSWPLSEVAIRRSQVAAVPEPRDDELAAALRELLPAPPGVPSRFLLVPMVLEDDGTWEGPALGPDGTTRTLRYRTERGLEVIS